MDYDIGYINYQLIEYNNKFDENKFNKYMEKQLLKNDEDIVNLSRQIDLERYRYFMMGLLSKGKLFNYIALLKSIMNNYSVNKRLSIKQKKILIKANYYFKLFG